MGLRRKPHAFTEQGVAMLSSVLRSPRAVAVNIEIMRAFVRLRRMLATHADLAHKLDTLERKYDAQFKVVFDAIRQLMAPPPAKRPELRIPYAPQSRPKAVGNWLRIGCGGYSRRSRGNLGNRGGLVRPDVNVRPNIAFGGKRP